MSLTKDCGDRQVSLNLIVGISYRLAPTTEEELAERNALMEGVMEIKENLEKTVLNQICDHIGLNEEEVAARVETRDAKNAADRKAETEGRAAKTAQRAGLPPPTVPPATVRGLATPPSEDQPAESM